MPRDLSFEITANVVDVLNRRIFPGRVEVADGKIVAIRETGERPSTFVLPGLIDAHVHVESSMLVPSEFARAAVVHGTVASVSDPHEIGNVLGTAGVEYMLENAAAVPFKFNFGAPSCVPATVFETAGAAIDVTQVARLLDDPRIGYLSEMMNYPGVLAGDKDVLAKIAAAQLLDKPVDGHAPGLRGEAAAAYIAAGITTDHECFTKDEALDKLRCGAKILIREGSAARNFDALCTLIDEYPEMCMLCSDDKHPDELLAGHINVLVRRAIERGIDRFNVLRAACVNPVLHYGMNVGLLRPGDDADFIEVGSLERMDVLRTFIRGRLVAADGQTTIPRIEPRVVNRFHGRVRTPDEFRVRAEGERLNVIEAIDGQLITRRLVERATVHDGLAIADAARDILKIAVVNRYVSAAPAVAFVRSFGLKRGAIASSVAHDSHNVIAVGVDDDDLCAAINFVIEAGGGLSVAGDGVRKVLPLPVAGLMSTETCAAVGAAYALLDQQVKSFGSQLRAPFMTLSFMALLVIPDLKLSDKGLFDGKTFQFLPLFAD
ncbi:MAG: adenine deaminase [Planctomycetaceae bacterium]